MSQSVAQEGERGSAASPLWIALRRRLPWLDKDTAIAILMLTPSIIAVAVFIYGFIGWTGYVSLVKWDSPIEDYSFVGLRNWIRLFKMERFHWNLRNLVLYAAGFMGQCIIFGFVIAVLLDQNIRGEAVFRTIVIFPFAVSAIVTGVAWRWLMQPRTGINLLLERIGLVENLSFAWNAHPRWGILSITIAAAWQFTGYVMALYLAGLRGISEEIREAAKVDGAGAWALYRRIIIPLLRPVTFSALVLTGMNSIRVYDLVTVLGGPAHTTDTLGFHMYQSTFGLYRFSTGATIGFFMILLSAFLVGPYLRSMQFEEGR
jgi:glucose/mannose transport system permease protein